MNIKLGDLCKIQAGGTPSRNISKYWENGDIPWVKIGDIESKFLNKTTEFITKEGLNNSSAKMIEKGSILYTIFATLGEVCITNIDVTTNQAIAGLTLRDDKVDLEYLYYFLKSLHLHVNSIGRGVAQNNINLTILREFSVPVPNRKKQLEIANILKVIENIIESRKKQIQEYDQLIKSRFVEMFGEVEFNTNSYKLVKYGDVFELNAGGTPSRRKTEYWENGTISWIGSNLCQNNIIYENDGQYITEEGYKNSSAKLFPIDTVLVALVGATIGKTALLKFETTTNQNVLGIRNIRESGFNPYFVYYYTQGLYNRFINIGGGGFSMASKKFISDLDIAMVKLEDQNKFAKFVQQVDKLKFEVLKLLRELR